ncbi:related to Vacuolar protein sorting-associated protein 53 [Saccharomycodes ludwigii]|uniref:Related to Vacuolar protein sorting-associated protein 53 n=1 Tax=Saccharomycodes ludwigii TaxID=36035 RepID=A0A376B4R4_9ASCO|nr:related to Vacuolar protein sorting-associated protein 53 [Saccharomycodes ludwigii]
MDSIEYDPLEDLTEILSTSDAIDQLDDLIDGLQSYKKTLGEQINITSIACVKETEKGNNNIDFSIIDEMVSTYNDYIDRSETTQSAISLLTQDISTLDRAKKNITQSINIFSNLQALCDSYVFCNKYLPTLKFIEISKKYSLMCTLSEFFSKEYKSVDEINNLLKLVQVLKNNTIASIKKCYVNLFNGELSSSAEEEAVNQQELSVGVSKILDADRPSVKADMIYWIIDSKVLYELKEVFQVDDEASSLENLSRRFVFFKKVLNNFQAKYANYFPKEWAMAYQITKEFYSLTRKDLRIILKRELSGVGGSNNIGNVTTLFMESLQTTMDFEKYIKVKFSNRLIKDKIPTISSCFEPFITIWINNQNVTIKQKIIKYMSEPKLPDVSSGNNSTDGNTLIIPSSADLFRTYRFILQQTFQLLDENSNKEQLIFDLASFFQRWLIEYTEKILSPINFLNPAVNTSDSSPDKKSIIKYTVLLINTSDYCSTTIDELVQKLSEYVPNSIEKLETIFAKAKDKNSVLIANGLQTLMSKVVVPDLQFVWREFSNMDWANITIEDYSRYMISLQKILGNDNNNNNNNNVKGSSGNNSVSIGENPLIQIVNYFNKDIYVWNLWNRIITHICDSFLFNIVKILEPSAPFAPSDPSIKSIKFKNEAVVINIGEQLLLDAELLKKTLHSIPNSFGNSASSPITSSSSAKKRADSYVDSSLDPIINFIKLLIAPADNPKVYQELFLRLTNNCINPAVWSYILCLKSVAWNLDKWVLLWGNGFQKGNISDWFVFSRPTVSSHFVYFNNQLLNITDPKWKKFINGSLRVIPIKTRVSSNNSTRNIASPTLQQQSNLQKLGSRLFNR